MTVGSAPDTPSAEACRRLEPTRSLEAGRPRSFWGRRGVRLAGCLLMLILLPALGLVTTPTSSLG
jgi:hypothetical protein